MTARRPNCTRARSRRKSLSAALTHRSYTTPRDTTAAGHGDGSPVAAVMVWRLPARPGLRANDNTSKQFRRADGATSSQH